MLAALPYKKCSGVLITCAALLLSFALSGMVRAQALNQVATRAVVLETGEGRYPIGQLVDYFEDKDNRMTIEDIKTGQLENLWQPSTWVTPNFGFSRSSYWFRIQVENRLANNQEFLLELAYALHNHVEFYRVDSGSVTQKIQTGNLQPFHQRGFEHAHFVFPLMIKTGETATFYLKSRSSTSMQFPLTLWSVNKFAQEKTSEYGALMLYYGIVIVMIFYNLLLSISIRNVNYLYYVFYIASLAIFQSSLDGLAFQYLWPNYPTWATHCIPFFLGSTMFWLFRFSHNFLETKTFFPKLHKASNIFVCWAILIMALAFLVPYSVTIRMSASLSIFGLIFLAILGVWSAKTGYRPSRFYVTAFLVFFAGGVLSAARMFGWLPSNFFTVYGSQLGSAFEIVLLSLALGDKIRMEQKSNHIKIKSLNANLNDLNLQLEDKVRQKTRDIRAILETIELGIFTINRQRTIDPDYSSFMHKIFGQKDLSGLNPSDVLFHDYSERTEDMARTDATIRMSLGEEEFNFQMNKEALIREMTVKCPDTGVERKVSLDWSPMTQNGVVEKILVSVKDITELVKIQGAEKLQREELIYISEIINISETAFTDFMRSCQEALKHIDDTLSQSGSDLSSIGKSLRMDIHTLKGNAHFVGFKRMSEAIHHEEQYLQNVLDQDEILTREHFTKVQANIWQVFHTYERINNEVLQRKAFRQGASPSQNDERKQAAGSLVDTEEPAQQTAESFLYQERKLFEQGLNVFRYLDFDKVKGEERSLTVEILSTSFKNRYKRLDEYLRSLSLYTKDLAKDLGKAEPEVKYDIAEFYINIEAQKILRNSFVHIFRNALDHGIESADERLTRGKKAQGTIRLHARVEQNLLVILCSDDGRGINLKRLREIATERGLGRINDDPVQLAELVFAPGLSTAQVVSDISGRGIGMSAIRQMFEEHGAKVEIELSTPLKADDFLLFALKLTLPSHMFLADKGWLDSILEHAA